MSGLAAVLAGRHAPGVFLWHAAYDVEDVRHSVEHAGWTFGYADGWGTESVAEFHERVASALAFPGYYGRNLDALWDCLTDLVEPTVLLWDGWGPLAHADPERFEALLTVLRDRGAARPPFTVLMRGAGPDVEVPSLD